MGTQPGRLHPTAGLEVHEAPDGLIVFNPATDRVHHLNATAAALYELCDGSTDRADLPALLAALFAIEEAPSDAIEATLQELIDTGVLVES